MSNLHQTMASQRNIMATVNELYNRFLVKNYGDKTLGYLSIVAQELDDIYQLFKYQHDEIVRTVRETSIDAADVPYMVEKCFFEFFRQYFSFKAILLDSMPQDTSRVSAFCSTFAGS